MKEHSILSQSISPVRQGAASLFGTLLLWLLLRILGWTGIYGYEQHFPWLAAIAMLLLYSLATTVFSFNAIDRNKYWLRSIITWVVLAISGALFAWLVSGLGINEAKSYRWLYGMFGFVYLLLLSIAAAMRKIIEIAQKQDARLRGEE